MTTTLWWILSTVLVVGGVAGTVLPALPGTALVLAGIVLAAWIDGFTRVGVGVVAVVSVLAAMGWLLDYAAAMLGARRAGASRQALIGAAIGTVVGLFAGFIGVLFLPLVGAAVGEYLARKDEMRALRVGVATWLGLIAGLAGKVVIVFMMIGIYLGALIL